MSSSTQLVVIGAGPGGYAAAFYAADRGMQVALVDPAENPGGVCLYRGCIPSKALLHVAKVIDEAQHAAAWGVSFGAPDDRRRPGARVQEQSGSAADRRRRSGRTDAQDQLHPGDRHVSRRHTRCRSPRADRARPTMLTFEHAIIATGSRPSAVPGLSIDEPACDGLDRGARLARHSQVAAGRRRRLHRARARERLRRARHRR